MIFFVAFTKPCDGKWAEGGELKDGNMSTDGDYVCCQPFVYLQKIPKNLPPSFLDSVQCIVLR